MEDIKGVKIVKDDKLSDETISIVKITRQHSNGMEAGKAMRVPTAEVKDYMRKVESAIKNAGDGIIEIPEALAPLDPIGVV